ncbi:MAG TPA: hypothetical protein VK933_00815, partial [Longimicrobiales bacterium]|nr:hypothetical protein [Longimicrobiales bacterium]
MRRLIHGALVGRATLVSAAAAAILAMPARAQDHPHPAGDEAKLGKVEFPVSCSDAVRPQFERAVAMLHSFWFESAKGAFTSIIDAEPACAMAHWGVAMTMLGNPMTRATPSAAALEEGAAASARALELGKAASHREQMYIDAVAAYYADYRTRDHMARMASLEQAFA